MSWFKSLGIATKVILFVIAMIVVMLLINYLVFIKGYRNSAESAMIDTAASFTALADETKNHVATLFQRNAFDVERLLAETQAHVSTGGSYRDTAFFSALPIVAGWTSAGEAARREGLEFRITAFNARNPNNEPNARNDPGAGAFRAEMLRELESQIARGGPDQISRINTATNTNHFMRAIKLDNSCMICHGKPGHPIGDPDGDGKDPLGFAMEGWKPGDMHGAFEVQTPLDPLDKRVAGFIATGWRGPGRSSSSARCCSSSACVSAHKADNETHRDGQGDRRRRPHAAAEHRPQGRDRSAAHWVDVIVDNLHQLMKEVAGDARVAGARRRSRHRPEMRRPPESGVADDAGLRGRREMAATVSGSWAGPYAASEPSGGRGSVNRRSRRTNSTGNERHAIR